MRWKHWCHNGCGKCVVYIGNHITGHQYKCEKCGQIYEDKLALDWSSKVD